MSTLTLYGFIEDGSMLLRTDTNPIDSASQGFGSLTGEARNYLRTPFYLVDGRESRQGVLDEKIPASSISVVFDDKRFSSEKLADKYLTAEQKEKVFNILDRVVFQGTNTDTAIETKLTEDTELYAGYVASSFIHSDIESTISVYDTEGTAHSVPLKDWVEFAYDDGVDTIIFHLWLSLDTFTNKYPYTTITSVIVPVEITKLLNPIILTSTGSLDLLVSSIAHVLQQANVEASQHDQNGVYTFKTKYVISDTVSISLPFALVYCGANVPTTLECRKAIKEHIESNTSATDSEIEAILPELYIESRFYMTPLWDLYSVRTERDVYNSVWKYKDLYSKAKKVYTNYDDSYLSSYLEMLTNAQNKMITLSVPDVNNNGITSILEQHPTYQDYSTQVPGWKYMTNTTQEFAGKLIRAMGVLEGTTVSDEFITVTVSGVNYISFSAGSAEYLIMTQTSYHELVNK